MKRIIIVFLVLLLLSAVPFGTYAENGGYDEIYEYSGAGGLFDNLDPKTREFFESEGIDPKNSDWVNALKTENVFSHIWRFMKDGAKTPVKSGLTVLAVLLIAAAVKAYQKENAADTAVKFAVTLAVSGILISGIWGSINSAVTAIKGCGSFMLSFVPVFMGILSVSGAPVTAAASGGMLLAAAEFITGAAAFGITSVMGAYLSLSICSSVSPVISGVNFAETLKKTGMWLMSLCTTVFLGVLGARGAINSAADSLSVRTAKFIIGTCVPVVGTALSGAVGTVSSSLSLIKSSVGIFGAIVPAVIFLPIVAELLIWRLVLNVSSGICEIFCLDETSKLFKAVDGMLSFLLGALLLISATFIISLVVTISAGRAL